MAIVYKWQWLRGTRVTVRGLIGASNFSGPWSPVTITSNLMVEAGAGNVLDGVCADKPLANAKNVSVIVSNDIYLVKLGTGFAPEQWDEVSLAADGSVIAPSAGTAIVGKVIDINPVSGGYAKIQAIIGENSSETDVGAISSTLAGTGGAGLVGITSVTYLTATTTMQAALAELVARVYALEHP